MRGVIMTNSNKLNSAEKEQKLIKKIEKMKNTLMRLQEKRQYELGLLLYKRGLAQWDNATLDRAFAKLTEEFTHGHE